MFTTNGSRSISGFSKAKAALDATIVGARAAKGRATTSEPREEPAALVPWRLHDLRRTGVSTLARLGFDSVIVDKLLAHKPAKLRGVAAVYQRHDLR